METCINKPMKKIKCKTITFNSKKNEFNYEKRKNNNY